MIYGGFPPAIGHRDVSPKSPRRVRTKERVYVLLFFFFTFYGRQRAELIIIRTGFLAQIFHDVGRRDGGV